MTRVSGKSLIYYTVNDEGFGLCLKLYDGRNYPKTKKFKYEQVMCCCFFFLSETQLK